MSSSSSSRRGGEKGRRRRRRTTAAVTRRGGGSGSTYRRISEQKRSAVRPFLYSLFREFIRTGSSALSRTAVAAKSHANYMKDSATEAYNYLVGEDDTDDDVANARPVEPNDALVEYIREKMSGEPVDTKVPDALRRFIVEVIYDVTAKMRKEIQANVHYDVGIYEKAALEYANYLKRLSRFLFGDARILLRNARHYVHMLGNKFKSKSSGAELKFIFGQSQADFTKIMGELYGHFDNNLSRKFLHIPKDQTDVQASQAKTIAFLKIFCSLLLVNEREMSRYLFRVLAAETDNKKAPAAAAATATTATMDFFAGGGGGSLGRELRGALTAGMEAAKTGAQIVRHQGALRSRKIIRRLGELVDDTEITRRVFAHRVKTKWYKYLYFFDIRRSGARDLPPEIKAYLALHERVRAPPTTTTTTTRERDYRLFPDDDEYVDAVKRLSGNYEDVDESLEEVVKDFIEEFEDSAPEDNRFDADKDTARRLFLDLFFRGGETKRTYDGLIASGGYLSKTGSGNDNNSWRKLRVDFVGNMIDVFCTLPFLYKRKALKFFLTVTGIPKDLFLVVLYGHYAAANTPDKKKPDSPATSAAATSAFAHDVVSPESLKYLFAVQAPEPKEIVVVDF